MRPLVKSAVFRMRTAPKIKETIEERASQMNMTQTAYIEMLISRDAERDEDEGSNYDQEKSLA